MIRRIVFVAAIAALGAGQASAEYLGLPNGRSADPSDLPPLSVEGAFNTGDDYQNIGARVNYAVSPQLTVFGDFGLTEYGPGGGGGDADGNSFGAGVFFHLSNQRFLPDYDVSVKASYHTAGLEVSSVDVDITNIALEGIVSSDTPITEGGMKWYANAGINIVDVEIDIAFLGSDSDTEILLGGGVYLPVGPGELYGGIDFIDDLIFGVGYRYFVQ